MTATKIQSNCKSWTIRVIKVFVVLTTKTYFNKRFNSPQLADQQNFKCPHTSSASARHACVNSKLGIFVYIAQFYFTLPSSISHIDWLNKQDFLLSRRSNFDWAFKKDDKHFHATQDRNFKLVGGKAQSLPMTCCECQQYSPEQTVK